MDNEDVPQQPSPVSDQPFVPQDQVQEADVIVPEVGSMEGSASIEDNAFIGTGVEQKQNKYATEQTFQLTDQHQMSDTYLQEMQGVIQSNEASTGDIIAFKNQVTTLDNSNAQPSSYENTAPPSDSKQTRRQVLSMKGVFQQSNQQQILSAESNRVRNNYFQEAEYQMEKNDQTASNMQQSLYQRSIHQNVDEKLKVQSEIPMIKSNFLQTTTLVGERHYPRCIVAVPPSTKKSFMEEQGFTNKNDIGPCRAVGIVRPRLKKLKFYDWENKFNQAHIDLNTPFSQKTLSLAPFSNQTLQQHSTSQYNSKTNQVSQHLKSEIALSNAASEFNRQGGAVMSSDNMSTQAHANQPKNFVWYKGLSQLYVDETAKTKPPNVKELAKQCEKIDKQNNQRAKQERYTKSDYNLKRCGMRSLLIMSQKSVRANTRGGPSIDQNNISQQGPFSPMGQTFQDGQENQRNSIYSEQFLGNADLFSNDDANNSNDDDEDTKPQQEFVYSTNAGQKRLDDARGIAMRTRVFDTKRLANKLLASKNHSKTGSQQLSSLQLEELQQNAVNRWTFQPMKLVPKSTTTTSRFTKSIQNFAQTSTTVKNDQSFYQSNMASQPQKVVLRRKDYAVDEQNPQGALHYLDLELGSKFLDAAAGKKTKPPTPPLKMDPQELTEFMSQRNARKDHIRNQKTAKAVLNGKMIAEKGFNRVPSETRLQIKLFEDFGKVVPDHKVVDLNSLTPEEIQKRVKAEASFKQKITHLENYKGEFKNRDKNFNNHEFSDKLIVMNLVENELHGKINAQQMLGPELTSKNKYFEDIQPIAALKKAEAFALKQYQQKAQKNLPNGGKKVGPDARKAEKRALQKEQRDQMINTYKDRLLPRFKV